MLKKAAVCWSFVHDPPIPVGPRHAHHVLCRPEVANVQVLEPWPDLAPDWLSSDAMTHGLLQVSLALRTGPTRAQVKPRQEAQTNGIGCQHGQFDLLTESAARS